LSVSASFSIYISIWKLKNNFKDKEEEEKEGKEREKI
jgi:hypothetical protein